MIKSLFNNSNEFVYDSLNKKVKTKGTGWINPIDYDEENNPIFALYECHYGSSYKHCFAVCCSNGRHRSVTKSFKKV